MHAIEAFHLAVRVTGHRTSHPPKALRTVRLEGLAPTAPRQPRRRWLSRLLFALTRRAADH